MNTPKHRNPLPAGKLGEHAENDTFKKAPPSAPPGSVLKAGISKRFRRLKWNELVDRGDFVLDEQRGYEPWQGLSGFRAGSFVKQIYRQLGHQPLAAGRPVSIC